MKEVWNTIKQTVEVAPLTPKEKKRVLSKIDESLGSYYFEDKIPVSKSNLTINEYIVYRDIIEAVNNARAVITNDSEYEEAVNYIFSIKNKQGSDILKKFMIKMDDHFKNHDWKGVNIYWNKIKEIL